MELEGQDGNQVLDWQITSLSIIKIGIINPCGDLLRLRLKRFTCINLFNPSVTLGSTYSYSYSHSIDKESGAPRELVTGPRSYSN